MGSGSRPPGKLPSKAAAKKGAGGRRLSAGSWGRTSRSDDEEDDDVDMKQGLFTDNLDAMDVRATALLLSRNVARISQMAQAPPLVPADVVAAGAAPELDNFEAGFVVDESGRNRWQGALANMKTKGGLGPGGLPPPPTRGGGSLLAQRKPQQRGGGSVLRGGGGGRNFRQYAC